MQQQRSSKVATCHSPAFSKGLARSGALLTDSVTNALQCIAEQPVPPGCCRGSSGKDRASKWSQKGSQHRRAASGVPAGQDTPRAGLISQPATPRPASFTSGGTPCCAYQQHQNEYNNPIVQAVLLIRAAIAFRMQSCVMLCLSLHKAPMGTSDLLHWPGNTLQLKCSGLSCVVLLATREDTRKGYLEGFQTL